LPLKFISISRLLLFFFFTDYEKSYDNAICRLMVRPWDNWRGINPSGVGEFNPDPPIFAAKFAKIENYNHILAIANEDGRVS
jgi:denticleless